MWELFIKIIEAYVMLSYFASSMAICFCIVYFFIWLETKYWEKIK